MNTQSPVDASFSPEEHQVWTILYDRSKKAREEYGSSIYLKGLNELELSGTTIPDLKELSNLIRERTNWTLMPVEGLVPEMPFFKMLHQRKFPVVNKIRERRFLNYVDAPDLFHDVCAHVPMLMSAEFSFLLSELGNIAHTYNYQADVVKMLASFYWYTAETGLVYENNELKIFGAAIISSQSEALNVLKPGTNKRPFDTLYILRSSFNYSNIQQEYFCLHSCEEFLESIPIIKNEVDQKFVKINQF